jgi:hypothetical protein
MCQVHAEMFYTSVVRIAAGLAVLNRAVPPGGTFWERPEVTPHEASDDDLPLPPQLQPARWLPTPGERTCRWPACGYAARSRHGTLCAVHLVASYRARSERSLGLWRVARDSEAARRLKGEA